MSEGQNQGLERDASSVVVAVLDIGKTNIKLNAVTIGGVILETKSVPNVVVRDGPWAHHDLNAISDWLFDGLADLSKRHRVSTFVTTGHGSGGVLVGGDPHDGDGAVLPMIDYEQPLPVDIRDAYAPRSGTFFDRGSATMHAATHQARQMFWMQQTAPQAFAKARWFLGIPQYWAWRLSGVAVSETTTLGAQSHLWNVAEKRWSPIVASQGWGHLMPPFAKAWDVLGRVRPALARRYGLRDGMAVLAGLHDSSANVYRYQAAGFSDATVVSTGTWIVAMSGKTPLDRLDEHRGMTCNSDVHGRPLGGVLTMGGREFSHIVGVGAGHDAANAALAHRLIAQGTMAIPSFGDDDGLFPGSAGKGEIVGPPPRDGAERKALAVIYTALLTVECLDALDCAGRAILDGSFVRDPLYAALISAFRPQTEIFASLDAYGVASGAALLADHATRTTPVPIALEKPSTFDRASDLAAYAGLWRAHAKRTINFNDTKIQERLPS